MMFLPFNPTPAPLIVDLRLVTLYIEQHSGPVHKGMNHVPKAGLDRDPLPDWVRDLNYVRSHALQTPSQSRTGSAHCEVIFCSC